MLSAPGPISDRHATAAFDSGEPALDDWLRRRALRNEASGASRCYVVCDGDTVAGYYALAAGAVALLEASGRLRRNMPDPVPVVVLARLAIDRRYQQRGLGRALFADAARRAIAAADVIGARGLLVHAWSAEAREFWLRLGLDPSPLQPMTLMATLADLRDAQGA